ncbi:C4-dicarboxylate ABC transporter [Mycobacterium sp. MFM001]|nr:C4-dicarboxylate ABC transporter [Mycobacterium sp. MFM001]
MSAITLSPDVFSVVMATGILSVAAQNHHYTAFSNALSVLAVVALVGLVVLTAIAAAAKRQILPWSLADAEITLPLFTFVAACTIVANRLSTSYPAILPVLGAISGLVWLLLGVLSIRNLTGSRLVALRDQAHGAWLLSSVATSGLAIVAAKLASTTGNTQWLIAAVAVWALALALYIMMVALMAWRAVAERLDRDGFEPDAWILMGSMAIAVVAGHYVHQQAGGRLAEGMHTATMVCWIVATLWIPPLIYFGLHRIEQRPKLLQFTGAWWTLVFPLGMYSAATYMMATNIHQRALQTVALVVFWNALLAWVSVAVAGLLRIPGALRTLSTREPRHLSSANEEQPQVRVHTLTDDSGKPIRRTLWRSDRGGSHNQHYS